MIRSLLNAPGKWVTSSLARAARFSSAGRKSITRHRQCGAWWQRGSGAAVGTIQQQGAVGMSHVKKEMEDDGVIEGSKREWRDGHEDGNLKET